ncbi:MULTISPECIES: OmpH family outer membrane protein [Candidatus Ichthyocystis]|uniref:OmpH family outer membrane protein n=1 Tax=Candidatus Ichthyocystis TaxID=2929841 RepID=UPI0015857DAF|nr:MULTISPECIES: OmpH family outer membrane protein [Ichthyocystis]
MRSSIVLFSTLFFLIPSYVYATKIGFVDTRRILRESQLALDAEHRLLKEFEPRLQKVKDLEASLGEIQAKMDGVDGKISYDERHELERKYNELTLELHMARRDSAEALNSRRKEEYQRIIRAANSVVRKVAARERYDAILQEAVYVNKNVDITDQVLKQLSYSQADDTTSKS